MICDLCGKEGAKLRCITETYGKGQDLLMIKDIPMVSCPNCGESYFTAETLRNIEYLRQHAAQSSQQAFEDALAEVPDVEPEEYDKL